MPIQSSQLSIQFLFKQKHTFVVPKHQRGYAWEQKSIDDFISDINRCLKARENDTEKNHFFGGVITVQEPVPNSGRSNYGVIDGQQRLASFVLLAAAIIQGMQKIVSDLDSKGKLNREKKRAKAFLEKKIVEIREIYLIYKDEIDLEPKEVPKITLSKADDTFFQNILNKREDTPKRASHERIQSAWHRLVNFVDTDVLGESTLRNKIKCLKQLVNKVLKTDCSAIFMCSDTKGASYQIFLVLNDRGEYLTSGDLLRAHTMEMLDDASLSTIQNKTAEFWDQALIYPRDDIENYLYWYYSSWQGKRPIFPNLVGQFLKHRLHYDEETIVRKSDAQKICAEVRQLSHEFDLLKSMGAGDWPCANHGQVTKWDQERLRMLVVNLKHTNAMPLLLSLIKLGPKKFSDAIASLERFVFRFKIIGKQHIGSATKLYLQHAQEIRKSDDYSIESLRSDLKSLVDKSIPDELFKANLTQIEYSPSGNNSYIRYFLITLEDHKKWHDQGARGIPKCKDKTRIFDFDNTTLEHIYPQTVTDREKRARCEKIKHTIGNLTILGPQDNSDNANKPFKEKREMLQQSNLWLNRDIGTNDKWTETEIRKRSTNLIKMALKVFVP